MNLINNLINNLNIMKLLTDEQELDIQREKEFFELFSKVDITKDYVESLYTKILLEEEISDENIDIKNIALKIKEEIQENKVWVSKILRIFDKYYWWNNILNIDDMLAEIMGNRGVFFKL